MSNKISKDETKHQTHQLPCLSCAGYTNHVVLTSITNLWNDEGPDISGRSIYEIVECKGCNRISFRNSSTNSEDYDYSSDGEMIPCETETLYPNRLASRKEINDLFDLPDNIRKIYKETHSVLSMQLNTLSGAGIRMLIEAVCDEKETKGNNLMEKINDLVEKCILTKDGADILHDTRLLGNRSVHELATPKPEELDVAIKIVENLLNNVYIIPNKAKILRLKK
jgi:hypothetical protein